jgi:DUF4097 and DUF4098 domain-containing protein YvlB
MKKYSLLLLITCFYQLSFAQDKNDVPFLTKSLTNESVKNIESETSGGSITVLAASAGEAKVEVFIWPANRNRNSNLSKEEIQKRLNADYDLTVSVSNNKLSTIAKPKRRNMDWQDGLTISFKIYVPANVSTDLSTSGGSIHLTGLRGTQRFVTSGGSLHVDNVNGDIKGQTSGGSIHVNNSNQDIDLSTSGGSIEANNCTGKIRLSTSGGSVHLDHLDGTIDASTSGGSVKGQLVKGELSAHTSGGNIDLQKLSCSLETSTSGGNIDVQISELGKFVKISNSGGSIDVELPNKGMDLKVSGSKVKTGNLSNFSGSVEEDEIDGKLNGGGVPVSIRAGSGRVTLTLK